MSVLTTLLLLMYLTVSMFTILFLRSKLFDGLRILSGIVFLVMIIAFILPVIGIDKYLILALGIAIISSVEITSYKQYKGDDKRLFLIHAFTIAMSLVLIILLFTI